MEALGIDLKLLFAQGINFLLFVFIFKKFIHKPFKAFLKKEQMNEAERTRLLTELHEKEATLNDKEKEIIADARAQAVRIIKEAEKAGGAKRQELHKVALEEIVTLKKKAEQQINEDRKKLYSEVKGHVVKTSETLTEAVLKDFIGKTEQKDMLNHIFKKLKESKIYEN